MRALLAAEPFDALAVSGDLTQRARPEQFAAARAFFASLSVPQVIVPGNHDVPLWALHERVFAPMARYRAHFRDEVEPVLKLPGAWICGLNTAKGLTAKNGVFRAAALARMEAFFAAAPRDVLRVVVAHHHLLPSPGPVYDPPAAGARDAAYALSRAGVHLVLAGHLHHAFIAHTRDFYPRIEHDTLVAHAGTSMSNRGRGPEREGNSLQVIEFDGERWAVEPRRHGPGGFAVTARYEFPFLCL